MPAGYIPGALGLALFAALALAATVLGGSVRRHWEHGLGLFGLALFVWGQYSGLFVAPKEAAMGDVGRILYVHVPAAWISMLAFTWAFAGSFGALMLQAPAQLPRIVAGSAAGSVLCLGGAAALDGTPRKLAAFFGVLAVLALAECLVLLLGNRRFGWNSETLDHFSEASTETGIVLGVLLLFLGAIFAKPTWGTYWTWDPRLTASAVMVLTFVGVSLLRSSVRDPETRLSWVSVATVIAYINIPITYMAVKWWRTMHQLQSTPDTLDPSMTFWLRVNAWAFLVLAMWFVARGWRLAAARQLAEAPPELPPAREVA
jgi:ABC-type transport system involved in cytochrome c biogenesis permease subunit